MKEREGKAEVTHVSTTLEGGADRMATALAMLTTARKVSHERTGLAEITGSSHGPPVSFLLQVGM